MTNIIKKSKKILLAILIIQIIFAIVNVSKAFSLDEVIQSADNFLTIGEQGANSQGNSGEIKTVINSIYSVIFPLGVAITIIVGGALGIKFMMASTDGKAKIKEMLVPYVIGCVVIYGALGIWKITIEVMDGAFNGEYTVTTTTATFNKETGSYRCNNCSSHKLSHAEVKNNVCSSCGLEIIAYQCSNCGHQLSPTEIENNECTWCCDKCGRLLSADERYYGVCVHCDDEQ